MQLASKLKAQNLGALATTAFFAAAGIIFLILLPLNGFPPHIALMGITSIIAAYGQFKKRFWAIWLIAALFLVATAFSIITIYYAAPIDAFTTAATIVYLILTWIFTIYAATHRKPKTE